MKDFFNFCIYSKIMSVFYILYIIFLYIFLQPLKALSPIFPINSIEIVTEKELTTQTWENSRIIRLYCKTFRYFIFFLLFSPANRDYSHSQLLISIYFNKHVWLQKIASQTKAEGKDDEEGKTKHILQLITSETSLASAKFNFS